MVPRTRRACTALTFGHRDASCDTVRQQTAPRRHGIVAKTTRVTGKVGVVRTHPNGGLAVKLSAKGTLLTVVVSGVLAVGCSTAGSSTLATDSSTPSAGPQTQATVAPSDPGTSPATGASPATLDRPWATATLTDVSTGGPFKIADLVQVGKVVFVQTIATRCRNGR